MNTTAATTLRAAIAAQLDDRAVEAETFSHARNYNKLYVYRDGEVRWSEFPDQHSGLIDDQARGFSGLLTLADVGTGSFCCNCDYCNEVYNFRDEQYALDNGRKYDRDSKYESQEDAVSEAVSNADLSDRVEDLRANLERIPMGYFNDEQE